jgi:tRNA modification GTPase
MTRRTTIFALASAPGRAAIAVFRISGPNAGAVLETVTRRPRPKPRAAALRRVWAPGAEVPFDEGLALWMPGPKTETGEDAAELQIHGGRAVAEAATNALLAAGAVPAAPGEFSRRAFEAGKLDLTQAEGVADLVDAETEAQLAQAWRQLQGALGQAVEGWREALLQIIARVEAAIDFPDEGDVAHAIGRGLAAETTARLDALDAEMTANLADAKRGERVRDGLRVAIIGAPNVGKSSLLNRLARREAAIVADLPGTTRDVVEVHLALAGQLLVLADTAGLRADAAAAEGGHAAIEAEGMRRALARAETADLRLGVVDAARPETLAAVAGLLAEGDLLWVNKADLPGAAESASFHVQQGVESLRGSAATGAGVDRLETALAARAAELTAATEAPPLTRARHRLALERASAALGRARPRLADAPELAAEDLRLCARALGEITGRVDVEEILDRVFADFCIGK